MSLLRKPSIFSDSPVNGPINAAPLQVAARGDDRPSAGVGDCRGKLLRDIFGVAINLAFLRHILFGVP